MKRRLGRPTIPAASRRTVHFKVCVSPSRYREIARLARARRVTVSALAGRALEALVASETSANLARQLAVRVEQLENECAVWERILEKHHLRTDENIRALADQLFNRRAKETIDAETGTGTGEPAA